MATISGFLNELAKGGPLRNKWTGGDKVGAMNDFGLDSDQQDLIKKAVASGQQPSKAVLDRISQKEIPALWVK